MYVAPTSSIRSFCVSIRVRDMNAVHSRLNTQKSRIAKETCIISLICILLYRRMKWEKNESILLCNNVFVKETEVSFLAATENGDAKENCRFNHFLYFSMDTLVACNTCLLHPRHRFAAFVCQLGLELMIIHSTFETSFFSYEYIQSHFRNDHCNKCNLL